MNIRPIFVRPVITLFVSRFTAALVAHEMIGAGRRQLSMRFVLFLAGFSGFTAQIVSGAPGDLFASINGNGGAGGGAIFQYTPAGVQSTFASGLVLPRELAFDGAGNLFVNVNPFDASGNTLGAILKFAPNGTESTFATGFGNTTFVGEMAIDKTGDIFVTAEDINTLATTIIKFTPGGAPSTFFSTSDQLIGLAFDGAGNLYASDNPTTTGNSKIVRFTPGAVESTFATASSSSIGLSDLTVDSAGNVLVSAGASNSAFTEILKFTSTGVESTFASGLNGNRGLAFDSAGNLFVVERPSTTTGDILEFTPAGVESVFASGIGPSRGNGGPTDLTFQPAGVPDTSSTWTLLLLALTAIFGLKLVLRHQPI